MICECNRTEFRLLAPISKNLHLRKYPGSDPPAKFPLFIFVLRVTHFPVPPGNPNKLANIPLFAVADDAED